MHGTSEELNNLVKRLIWIKFFFFFLLPPSSLALPPWLFVSWLLLIPTTTLSPRGWRLSQWALLSSLLEPPWASTLAMLSTLPGTLGLVSSQPLLAGALKCSGKCLPMKTLCIKGKILKVPTGGISGTTKSLSAHEVSSDCINVFKRQCFLCSDFLKNHRCWVVSSGESKWPSFAIKEEI